MATGVQVDLLSPLLAAISKRLNQESFDTWFQPISRVSKDASTLYITVPNEVFRDWISTNYFDVLEESLEELNLTGYKIEFPLEENQRPSATRIGQETEMTRSRVP